MSTDLKDRTFAVINPAAGSGKCGKLAPRALEKLSAAGIEIDAICTKAAGDGTTAAREAYARGYRRFIAVGGDGTSYEIVNGVFPESVGGEHITLGFLPLGTGNSFLRDFTKNGLSYATDAIVQGKSRPCDVLRVTHSSGEVFSINLLSVGFSADVAALTNRRFKGIGHLGYLLGVFACLAKLNRGVFPVRVDDSSEFNRERCLLLSLNNSKWTGGNMMIGPRADISDGLIDFVRMGPISRTTLLLNLHTLFDGSHVKHPFISSDAARRVEFQLERPVDVMVDGEVFTLDLKSVEVLPQALDVMA